MSSNILHIAGTDTEIGKTTVASLLVRALCKKGLSPWIMKPVQTGCAEGEDGELIAGDAVKLRAASDGRQSIEDVILYRYRSPTAPVVAAAMEGEKIDYSRILEAIQDAASRESLVIYEGTGGLMVPLTEDRSFLDLARELRPETLVVVGSRLGAINHASLTFHALETEKISCMGYILNDLFADGASISQGELYHFDAIRTNRKLLQEVAKGYGLNELAYLPFLAEGASDENGLRHFDQLADRLIEKISK